MNNTWKKRRWMAAGLLLLLVVVTYLPVRHAGFIWDDERHVTENVNLRSVPGLYRIWFAPLTDPQYYPLQLTSYWTEYHLWGLWPLGYHVANVLLHGLNALLVWMVLLELEIPVAWVAAAIFAVHPVQVESVAWVSELKNLLSTTFYLGALLAFLRYQPLSGPARRAPAWRLYWLALVLFVCALLSKTVACSLPAVLALLIWWKRGRVKTQDIKALSPMFLVGITLGLITAWLEKRQIDSIGAESPLSFLQRCLLAGRVLWFYAGKLLWPHPLIFIYPRWEIDPGTWWQYLFPAGALVVLLALWLQRSRLGRGPLVAVLCFAVALAPALGFFDVFPFRFSYVADHFQYLASVGLIVLVVATGASLVRSEAARVAVSAVVIAVLGALSWQHCVVFYNEEALWRDTIARNPRCWVANNNLGLALAKQGKEQEAIGYYEQALRVGPDDAKMHNNLGNALTDVGRNQEAIGQYEQALRLRPHLPGAHNNLGNVLLKTGKTEEAIAQYKEALRLRPDYPEAHYNLGNALVQAGKLNGAIGQYEQALHINPGYIDALYHLADALGKAGRAEEAITRYEQALRLQPGNATAHNNVGLLYAAAGKPSEAMAQYREALRLKPDYANAYNNLAWLLATSEGSTAPDHEEAIQRATRASELAAGKEPIYLDTLAAACAAAGRFPEAVANAQQAIELARSGGRTELADEIASRLELYRAGCAYHEPIPVPR